MLEKLVELAAEICARVSCYGYYLPRRALRIGWLIIFATTEHGSTVANGTLNAVCDSATNNITIATASGSSETNEKNNQSTM